MPPFRLAAVTSVFARLLLVTQVLFSALFCLSGARAQTVVQKTDTVGASPMAVAVNPATGLVYVANQGSNTVSVIDGAGNAIGTISVGTAPAVIALNPVTNRIYIGNTNSTVWVIDGSSGTVVAMVPVAGNAKALAVNSVTNKVYVATGTVTASVIDGTNNATPLSIGFAAIAVAVNTATGKAYFAGGTGTGGNGGITAVDGSTNAVATPLSLPVLPYALAVNPITNKVYVSNGNGASVAVVTGGLTLSSTIVVGTETEPVAVDPVSNTIYFGGGASTSVFVVDGGHDTLSRTVTVGGEPFNIAIDSVTKQIYVANGGSGTVSVIDGTGTSTSSSSLTVGSSPNGVAINPVSHRVYVANQTSGSVSVIDGAVNKVSTISTANNSYAVALNPVTNQIYVCAKSTQNNLVYVINATTNAVSTVTVGNFPYAVAVNPVTNKIYVANNDDGTVTVIDGATLSTTTVTADVSPVSVAINTVTNKAYVATQNSVVVIDSSNTPSKIATGTYFYTVAANPATNRIYAAGLGAQNAVTVIDGSADTVVATVPTDISPQAIAINPVTNTIYVANNGNGDVTVINGTQNTVTATVNVAGAPQSLAVNPATNRIYVSNSGTLDGSVIDGSTNTVIASPLIGNSPTGTILDPLTNKIYVTDSSGSATVIDGATDQSYSLSSVTSFVSAAINTFTGKVYLGSSSSTGITVLDPFNAQTVPLTVSILPVSDSNTVSTTNVFQTTSPTPSFTATAVSSYATSNAYGSMTGTVANPVPTAIYYQVDSGSGAWTEVGPTSTGTSKGSPTATFAVTLPPTAIGLHTLYMYATYGDEGSGTGGSGISASPQLGSVAALLFQIDPTPTTTTVSSSANPARTGTAVTLTATVSPATATGMVKFVETTPAGTAVVLGTYTLSGGTASVSTSFPTSGNYGIMATYLGSAAYGGSSGNLSETVTTSDITQTTITPAGTSTITYGGSQTYTVNVIDTNTSSKTPTGTVSFYDIANSRVPFAVVPLPNGQASYTFSAATVGSRSFFATFFPSDSASFSLSSSNTVTLVINKATPTVNVDAVSVPYGTASATLTARVAYAGPAAPTGTVSFQLKSGPSINAICSGSSSPLLCTVTGYPTGTLSTGPYELDVTVAADNNYTQSPSSSYGTLSVIRAPLAGLTITPISVAYDAPSVSLSVTVTYTGVTAPSGVVSIYLGATVVGIASCPAGTGPGSGTPSQIVCQGPYRPSLPSPGSYTLTAQYSGDGNYNAATASGTLRVTAVTPTISATPVYIIEGSASAALSAQIAYTGAAVPTGAVYFSVDAGTSVTGTCTGTKSPLTCTASYAASGLSKGLHNYSVTEAADSNYIAAGPSSSTLTVASGVPICTLTLQSGTPVATPPPTGTGTPPTTATGIPVGAVTSCTDPNGKMLTPTSLDWGDGTSVLPNPSPSNSHPYDVPPGTTKMFTVTLSATINNPTNTGTVTGTSTQVLTLTAPPAVNAGTSLSPVPAMSTPTSQPLKVTFLCTSVTAVYDGITQATNALPSAYGITCSSQGIVDLDKSSITVPVTVNTTAGRMAGNTGGPSLPASRSGRAGTVAYAATGLICLLACMSGRRRKALTGASLLMLCITVSSCGGSFTAPVVTVTHSGTYFVTVTEVVTPPPSPPLTNFVQTSLIVKLSVN